MVKKIKSVIAKLKMYIQNDGGDMEFDSYDRKTKTLIIKVKGACVGCSFFDQTFDYGMKESVMLELPEIKNVVFVTK
ncbi:MAG: NifU family protein [Mycoplasmataceae bacterium]|jgi:Fe-S cluster biogenesis protein NfuA|nr:NifU family protein [Mycoplasmataceae bacterium]